MSEPVPVCATLDSLDRAPELARWHDQPAQMPAGAPGKVGRLRMRFAKRGERTALVDLYRQAPLLVQQALYWDEAMPDLACVFVCSTSGGVLQGDRLAIDITLGEGARAHVTTQGATRLQEMDANYATQTQSLALAAGAYLEYLPEALIPYRHARFASRTEAVVDPEATLVCGELVMPGRTHHRGGERFEYDLVSLAFSARRPDGTCLFDERLVLEPARGDFRSPGVMGSFDVFASVLAFLPASVIAKVHAEVETGVAVDEGWACGATRLPGDAGLAFRVLGATTAVVRAKVRRFRELVRREATGCALPPEFAWR